MAASDTSSPGMLSDSTGNPDDKLGYSRHYAQRIRDLGKTSKESWIKRLWNHMFGNVVAPTNQETWPDDPLSTENTSSSLRVTSVNDSLSYGVTSQVNSTTDKEVRFAEPDNSSTFGDNKPSHLRDSDSRGTNRNCISSPKERSVKTLPTHLVNSPYLPPKDKVVYYKPAVSSRSREDSRDGVAAAKLRYQKLSSSKVSVVNLSSASVPNIRMSGNSGNATRQNAQVRNSQEAKGALKAQPKTVRNPAMVQLEKRAKAVADRAVKVGLFVVVLI